MNTKKSNKKHEPKGCVKLKSKLEQVQQELKLFSREIEKVIKQKILKEDDKNVS